jgi:hypothetical protein
MTPADRQAAALDRLRAKGLGLAPHMVDGKVVSKRSGKRSDARRALPPRTPETPAPGVTTPDDAESSLSKRIPGTVFEFTIPAPCEFLNANRSKGHWGNTAPLVKKWRRAGRAAAAAAGLPLGLARLQVDCFVWKPIANDYDPANWAPTAKACLDGMIDYGLAEDDNRRFVTGPFMHEGGKGSDALIVRVTVLPTS